MTIEIEDDTNLLRKIAERDKSAMRAFFERYQSSLAAFIVSRGADPSLASDVVQEAMLDVWRRAGTFGGHSSAKTWLFAIARNKFVDTRRKTARETVVEDVGDTLDETPNAEAVMIAVEEAGRVRACLDKLTPRHRSVIRLAFFDDLTYAEIGRIEDAPEGTIKTRIFHAKKLLLRCLSRR